MKASKKSGHFVFEHEGMIFHTVKTAAKYFGVNVYTARGRIAKGLKLTQVFGIEPIPKKKRSKNKLDNRWAHRRSEHQKESETKTILCRCCSVRKVFSEFSDHRGCVNGKSRQCKACSRKKTMERRYGIGFEEYQSIYEKQFGKCLICSSEKSGGKDKKMCLDHCHETGKIRGLLCFNCNTGLGLFSEQIDIMERAALYLESL